MITLFDHEVKELIKQNKNHNLTRTCHHYYMCNDDYEAILIVAEMRGYDVASFQKYCLEGMHYR